MNLHQLELFVKVVETRGFSPAARAIHLAQSTVSTQIRELEQRVGLKLFRRTKGGLVLTEAGATLYTAARTMLEQRDSAQQRLEALRSGAEGTVSVGVSQTGALYGLLDAVRDYRRRNSGPQVDVSVDLADHLVHRLANGTLDLAVDWEPLAHRDLAQEPLGTYEYLVAMSPDDPLVRSEAVDAERFRRQPYFTLDYGTGSPAFVESQLARQGLLPHRVVRLSSIDTVKNMIAAGLGVSIMSSLSLQRDISAGRLVALPLEGFRVARAVLLLHRRGWQLTPATQAFREFLRMHPGLRRS